MVDIWKICKKEGKYPPCHLLYDSRCSMYYFKSNKSKIPSLPRPFPRDMKFCIEWSG